MRRHTEAVLGDVVQRHVLALRSQDVATLVHGDTMDPGPEARLASKRAKPLEGVNERALRGLVCRVVIAQHALGERVDAPLVALDEGFE